MSILNGPVAFIDDEVNLPDKAAYRMKVALAAHGRPVAAFDSIPDVSYIEHWRSLSFLVLDWDLSPGSFGGLGGSTLGAYARTSLFDFLAEFMSEVFCPVFIVSAEDTDDIERQLRENLRFGPSGGLDTRIRVFGKSAVVDDLLNHLESWVDSNLALSVLKVWEQQYEIAINRLFTDFNELDSNWPTYVWRNALQDHVEPSFELAATLTANLLHRIDVMKFDAESIGGDLETGLSTSSMRRVFNGRTVIPQSRLHADVIMPGDLFSDADNVDVVWLNLTPACQTVVGRSGEDVITRLYAVPGTRLEPPQSKNKFSDMTRESPNSIVFHALHEDSAYRFDLKSAAFLTWSEVSDRRVGRLLAPYITRAQQLNSLFMQIEGVPRATFELLYKEDQQE
ncbi:hypothetical protein IFU30_16265 [Plantibacter sp. CFBP 8798]|uniref:hypothetical protein n=1 Tax=Plantibacter sp. CFBP 8798 TaxID=2775268 RepID=UPI0017859FDD|nr:hypothetical protein [Plantibacter sp. CFBP 8798]MBD8467821.1 hypothetical protein [Plantibacter sp. CFBP 8798]